MPENKKVYSLCFNFPEKDMEPICFEITKKDFLLLKRFRDSVGGMQSFNFHPKKVKL